MRIVAINASHRGEKGFTQFLLNKMAKGATQEGALFETVVLARHSINRCINCEVCHTERSYLKCRYEDKDDVALIFEKIEAGRSPSFSRRRSISSLCRAYSKVFLDRLHGTGDSGKLRALQERPPLPSHRSRSLFQTVCPADLLRQRGRRNFTQRYLLL